MYRWIDHVSEVELRIEADSPEAVISEALEAVSELLGDPDENQGTVHERVALEAPDRPALLAAWLEELAFLAETRGLICERLVALEVGDAALEATVEARRGAPRHLVKAVTYHGLRFAPSGEGWVASAMLDV
jgi:SHS2 domain-containing protein